MHRMQNPGSVNPHYIEVRGNVHVDAVVMCERDSKQLDLMQPDFLERPPHEARYSPG